MRHQSRITLLAVLLMALFLGLASPVVAEGPNGDVAAFITGTEDIPLMPGLEEDIDAGTTFDTPAGRLLEAYAVGAMTPEQVLRFYTESMPQLGWKRKGENTFFREGEMLTIDFPKPPGNAQGPAITVHFTLKPKS